VSRYGRIWTQFAILVLRTKDGFMAGKPLNRLDLRRQREAAEPLDPMEDEADEAAEDVEEEEVTEKKPKKKPKAAPKSKAKSARAPKPAARMRIVWVVMNDAFKPVATFEYNQKEAADAKAAEMTARGKGTHFVQRTKEAMPEDAPGIGAAIPRIAAPAAKKAVKEVEAPVDEEEDAEEEEDSDVDVGDDADDDDE
jgi:hypothetical protein